jgi:hypothetical protein
MVSTAHSYASLQRRLDAIFVWVKVSTPGFSGYASKDVATRLIQRWAELSVFEFTRIAAERYRKSGHLPDDGEIINCAGLLIEGTRKFRLTPLNFMALFLDFIGYWCYVLLMIMISLKPFSARRPLTMLYGVGLHDLLAEGSDVRFLHFCRSGNLPPLVAARHLIVQAVQPIKSSDPLHVRYGRIPLLLAMRWAGLGFRAWLATMVRHVLAAFGFIWAVCLQPCLILLGRDAASHAAAVALNRQDSIRDIILTNSNYFSQPLWTWALPNQRHVSHMAWYSQNNYPISFADEDEAVPIPNLRYVRADIQWVWSEGFKYFLQEICPPCTYKVVSPIVWHLPSKSFSLMPEVRRIALFDITPINHATELKLGLIRNFYTEEIMISFIRDVVEATRVVSEKLGVKIVILLKHKRVHHVMHSAGYIETVCKYADTGDLILVEPTANLHDLVQESDFVIAAPYSSPVYLSRAIGKDAVWYDPTATLDWKLETQEVCLLYTSPSPRD